MKNYWLFLYLIFVLNFSCLGQRPMAFCDTLILDEHTQKVLKIRERCLYEYILKRNLTSPEFLSNRQKLEGLNLWVCNNSNVFIFDTIENQVVELHLEKGIKSFKPEMYIMPQQTSTSSASLQLYDYDNAPFGFLASDTIVNFIKTIEIRIEGKEINIPNSAYGDLLYPNFCNTELSIKPIEAYCSLAKDKIYLYICGEYRINENVSHHIAFQNSYMAKLIIDLKHGYQSRIVVRGNQLCYYDWDNQNFIGF